MKDPYIGYRLTGYNLTVIPLIWLYEQIKMFHIINTNTSVVNKNSSLELAEVESYFHKR